MKYSSDDLKDAIENNLSIAGVLRQLHLRPVGGNYKTIYSKIKEYGLDISHFTGQGWNIGLKFKPQKMYNLLDILIKDSPYKSIYKLKNRLLQEGYKKAICECCNLKEWLDKPISLELHHINGVNTDHRLENLQLLCPNCHAQTSNHRGKAKLSALSEKREVEYSKFREALTDNADGNPEPSLNNKEGAETLHCTSK